MELMYDWKGFQSTFYGRKSVFTDSFRPVYLVVDHGVIISAYSDGEDLTEWLGATEDELVAEFPKREIYTFSKSDVETWLLEACQQPHFHDQTQLLRTKAKPLQGKAAHFKVMSAPQSRHFLLDSLVGWWNQFLPTSYGIFICLSGELENSLFLMVQRGRLTSFHVPDFSTLSVDRRQQPAQVVRFLAERQVAPVQGFFISADDWKVWSESTSPWLNIAKSIQKNRSQLVPFRWGVAAILMLRGYLKL